MPVFRLEFKERKTFYKIVLLKTNYEKYVFQLNCKIHQLEGVLHHAL